jgi:hypothetical protein
MNAGKLKILLPCSALVVWSRFQRLLGAAGAVVDPSAVPVGIEVLHLVNQFVGCLPSNARSAERVARCSTGIGLISGTLSKPGTKYLKVPGYGGGQHGNGDS